MKTMATAFSVSIAVAVILIGMSFLAYGMTSKTWEITCERMDATAVRTDRVHFICVTADGRVIEP